MTPRLAFALTLLLAMPTISWAGEFRVRLERASDPVLARPHDLALSADERFLYVADLGHDVVTVLDASTLRREGAIGKGELAAPHDVAFDREGRLMVADTGNNRVAIYTVNGIHGSLVGELKGGLSGPEGVAQGPDGTIYVSSVGTATLTAFRGGRQVAKIGSHGSAPGQFSRPHDVEVDRAGNIHVVDSGNNRIQIFDAALRHQRSLMGPPFNLNDPKYLFIGPHGGLWIADQRNNRIKLFESDFTPRGTIGSGAAGSAPGDINNPEGVLVRGDRVWISDTYNDRVLLYRIVDRGLAGAR